MKCTENCQVFYLPRQNLRVRVVTALPEISQKSKLLLKEWSPVTSDQKMVMGKCDIDVTRRKQVLGKWYWPAQILVVGRWMLIPTSSLQPFVPGDRKTYDDPEWYNPWEHLRSFFFEYDYDLFRPRSGGLLSISKGTRSPASDSYGLYGDSGNGFRSVMGRVSPDFLHFLTFSNRFSSTLSLS